MTINEVTKWGDRRQYTVVDKIPDGYSVWNIAGIEDHPEYLPLCICYGGTYTVIMDRLLAIKVPADEQKIMHDSTAWGGGSLKIIQRKLNRNLNQRTRVRFEKALPLFEKYSSGR